MRATKRSHEQPFDLLAPKPLGKRTRLLLAGVGQHGVGTAVDEWKQRAGVRSFRRAVTGEDDLRRAFGQRKRPLLRSAALLCYLGAAQGSTSTLIDSFLRSCMENASPILSSDSRWVISGSTWAIPLLRSSTASRKSSLVYAMPPCNRIS